jgi:hypothetical protein
MAMRIVTDVRQYLAAGFLIVIGLMASGCGDTASVNQNAALASLAVDPGSLEPAFSAGTTQYNVNLSTSVTSVTITAQPAVSGDTVTINGQNTTSSVITLGAAGTTTPVNIVVSGSGADPGGYTVLLIRAGLAGNNSLQNLDVSPGNLAPTFEENFLSYTVDVPNTVGSIAVTPTLSDTAATMTVNGQATNSGQTRTVTLNPAGQDTAIPIVVTAQNNSTKRYTVTVSRGVSGNNNLQSLTTSPGTLNPAFNANRASTSYTVNVASTVTSVTVTPRLQDATASMTVNGQATNSGQARPHPLGAPGSTPPPIFIVVTAQNGTQKTYTVGVNRAALGGNNNLSGLTVSPGSLSPTFSAGTEDYTVNVASTVTSITVTPTRQDPNATITVNGTPSTSGQGRSIALNGAGSNTLINIAVTAPNGNQKSYSVNVIRAALGGNDNLQSLTVSQPGLTPTFRADRTVYTLDVGASIGSITVTAAPADPNATLTVTSNGQVTASGQTRTITLRDAGSSTTINLAVRAPNGSLNAYVITVDRAAPPPPSGNNNLENLTVSPGTLSSPFTNGTTTYTVNNVSSSATSILVTATPQDSSATVTINTQGGNSRSIPLPGGPSSTEIDVRVIAPNGNDKTYSITVNQPAPAEPPAPTSAPDLIKEDDSCPLVDPPDPSNPNPDGCVLNTSKEDNITNVTTPRFTVAAPPVGATPNLYVGLVPNPPQKVTATFDAATNTLRPSTPLSDGIYTITYTLTNAGGESSQSPAIDPSLQISTIAPQQ